MPGQRDAAAVFADHVVAAQYQDIPPEAIEASKRDILDTLGCILAGTSAPGVKDVVELVRGWGGKGESTILGFGGRVPSVSAALANGTAGHARDFDDNHDLAQTHCGVCVVPAALAVAELKGGVSGKDFVLAVTMGLDLAGRMPLALGQWGGWHPTPVFGCFSAAATAGKLLGLGRGQMVNALGIAYSQAAGTIQVITDGVLAKRLHAGLAAKAGILSALLAQRGFTGVRNSLQGEYGFYNVYYQGRYDLAPALAGLGKAFEGVNLSFKPYPCCRDLNTAIDATLPLVSEHAITPDQVASITVGVNPFDYHNFCQPAEVKNNPRTVVDAQFSISYAVAAAIVDRKVGIDTFTEAAIKRPEVLEMTKKITCVIYPDIEQAAASTVSPPVKVEIRTRDGRVYSKRVDVAKGHPRNPMTTEEFLGKFRYCAGYSVRALPTQNIERAIETAMNLEKVDDASRLAQLLA